MKRSEGRSRSLRLRESYPISRRFVFRELIGWLLGAAGIVLLLILVENSSSVLDAAAPAVSRIDPYASAQKAESRISSDFFTLDKAALLVVMLFLTLKGVYLKLYEATYFYAVQRDRLVIRKGLLARETAMFPLGKITEIYLERSF